jgi:hypothetical protein
MSWPDFQRRAGVALSRLESLGVTFRVPPVSFASTQNGALELTDVVPNVQIWYSLDGSADTATWIAYRKPLRVGANAQVSAFATISGHRASVSVRNSLQNLSNAGRDVPVGS